MTTEATLKARIAHHHALKRLAHVNTAKDGMALWRHLRKIECFAESKAIAYCNGEIDCEEWQQVVRDCTRRVVNCLGCLPDGFFVNGDPRGYALKLDNEITIIPEGMHKDWGGYGILAPVID